MREAKRLTEDEKNQIDVLANLGYSTRKIAKLVLGTKSRKSTVADHLNRVKADAEGFGKDIPKVLFLDIESSFQLAGVFGRFNQNLSEAQVFDNSKLLGLCAKWMGSDDMMEIWPEDFKYWNEPEQQRGMLEKAWKLLDTAEYIIAHNINFDVKMLNAFFIQNGLGKPSPFRQIDTLRIARQNFRFDSNKLDSLGKFLGVGRKVDHSGIDLWMRCFRGETDAFLKMIHYCIGDIYLLEDIYHTLKPWDSKHPNFGIHHDDGQVRCGVCSSVGLVNTGKKVHTDTGSYELLKCSTCHSWHRVRSSEKRLTKTLVGVK